jgi:hypothetical protein
MAQKKTAFIINIGGNGYSPAQVTGITWGDLKAKLENEGISDNDTVILKNERDTASYYGIPPYDTVDVTHYEPEED